MDVTEAVEGRRSARAFTDEAVPDAAISDLLVRAGRAPSGGNLQPWRVYVLNGDSMAEFRDHLRDSKIENSPSYDIYPPKLWEPYRTNRFRAGEMLYESIGIPREDKAARLEQLAKNHDFFGAPAGLFVYVDERMGPPQWSDLGMFIQTFMLLAYESGYATCAQEYWSVRHDEVAAFVSPAENLQLFCGVSLGVADSTAPINSYRTERHSLDEWAVFV